MQYQAEFKIKWTYCADNDDDDDDVDIAPFKCIAMSNREVNSLVWRIYAIIIVVVVVVVGVLY